MDEILAKEATQAALALILLREVPAASSFGDAYKHIGVNFSIRACEIAAKITGSDLFFAKMLNHEYRTNAAEMMFERALSEVKP